ncbi:MAG: GNAT family N-acetyltransferase [Steroidobacteraceae bacterium]
MIATTHLRLRPFALSDISALVTSITQHRIADVTLAVPQPFDSRQARRWIESHARAWQSGKAIHWAVSTLEDDRLAGYVGLHNISVDSEQGELSLWIAERLERKDLGLEAAQATLAYAFAQLQINQVMAHQLAGNLLLARILRRLGMKLDTVRQTLCGWGRTEEGCLWSIDRGDWMKSLQDTTTH